jgi:hypothetical protein
MERCFSIGQSPQRAVVPMEEEEESEITFNDFFGCQQKEVESHKNKKLRRTRTLL